MSAARWNRWSGSEKSGTGTMGRQKIVYRILYGASRNRVFCEIRARNSRATHDYRGYSKLVTRSCPVWLVPSLRVCSNETYLLLRLLRRPLLRLLLRLLLALLLFPLASRFFSANKRNPFSHCVPQRARIRACNVAKREGDCSAAEGGSDGGEGAQNDRSCRKLTAVETYEFSQKSSWPFISQFLVVGSKLGVGGSRDQQSFRLMTRALSGPSPLLRHGLSWRAHSSYPPTAFWSSTLPP